MKRFVIQVTIGLLFMSNFWMGHKLVEYRKQMEDITSFTVYYNGKIESHEVVRIDMTGNLYHNGKLVFNDPNIKKGVQITCFPNQVKL